MTATIMSLGEDILRKVERFCEDSVAKGRRVVAISMTELQRSAFTSWEMRCYPYPEPTAPDGPKQAVITRWLSVPNGWIIDIRDGDDLAVVEDVDEAPTWAEQAMPEGEDVWRELTCMCEKSAKNGRWVTAVRMNEKQRTALAEWLAHSPAALRLFDARERPMRILQIAIPPTLRMATIVEGDDLSLVEQDPL